MDRAPGTTSAPRNGRAGEPSRRALDAMASAAQRAQESGAAGRPGHWPVIDRGTEETGVRRLVARTTTGTGTRQVGRASVDGGAGTASRVGRPPVPGRPATPGRDEKPDGGGTTGPLGMKARRAPAPRSRGGPTTSVGEALRPESDGPAWWTRWSLWLTRWDVDGRRARTLLATGAAVILVVVVAAVALGLALRSPGRPSTSRAGAARRASTAHHATTKATPKQSKSPSSVPAPTTPPTSAPSAAAPSPTGAPRLASISPSSGAAGQSIVINGSGLFSSNGEVVAYFGGTQAGTSCTSQTSCAVTVPDLGSGPAVVPVTVVTAAGRSNPLTFSYS
jgi:hypothetical protein